MDEVARAYVEAGSQIILTNTFLANSIALGPVTIWPMKGKNCVWNGGRSKCAGPWLDRVAESAAAKRKWEMSFDAVIHGSQSELHM